MKNIALKSALAASVVIATVASASAGSGVNHIFLDSYNQDSNSRIELELVRSETAGTVEIVELVGGALGDTLGTTSVNAGANSNVFVHFNGAAASNDVAAVLKDAAGNVVAIEEIEIDNF
ncbi:hypothetical protein [Candidatus Halocynthiibacter alkanivorans]|uniref:hypothetical protein n=1 Tax=Candidatus Halocynthiibacter alkanivorans TaxID=2267619 RepID=UPI000DF12C31|nr:hypothetical protein [Candidatus Halocynthiibacter alkanivorans]